MRECGFYWVRFLSEDNGEIAYWNGVDWRVTASEDCYSNEDFDEIDEKQIKREL